MQILVLTETVLGYCSRGSCCGEGCQCVYSRYDSSYTRCDCPSGVSPYNYTLSHWSKWTACNVSCGGNGTQHRYRTCRGCCSNQVLQEPRDCGSDACPVNGSWTSWGGFSSCDKSCGGGWKLRFRDCTSPSPADGGLPCIGDSVEVIGCNMFHCPIDGGWSSWSNFSKHCSGSCGQGLYLRTRTCSQPHPKYGGQDCTGNSTEGIPCNLTACPVDGLWGQWGHFRPCDMSCGGGIHIRVRLCNNPPPSHGGHQCTGRNLESETCNTQPCPDHMESTASSATTHFIQEKRQIDMVIGIVLIFLLVNCAKSYENVALNRPAWQQSNWPDFPEAWGAAKAVDGQYTDRSAGGNQCTISGPGQSMAEWRVDLQSVVSISHINILYRTDNFPSPGALYDRFAGFFIFVSNTSSRYDGHLCFHELQQVNGTPTENQTISCPVHERYVIYYNERGRQGVTYPRYYSKYAYNDLCELEVYG